MKILKNYFYTMSYQVIAIILPFITVPYISRVLGAEAVGINSYTTAIITYFVMIANVGLTLYGNRTISYLRESMEERSQKFWEIVFIKWIMAAVSLILFTIFILIYKKYSEFLFWQSLQILGAAVDISWFFTGLEDFKKTVTRNIIIKIVSAMLIFTCVKSPSDLALYIIIVAGSNLVGNITMWTYMRKLLVPIDWKELAIYVHFLPVFLLFIPQLANQLFMTINKLLLGNLSSISQTGYFDNADKIVRLLLTAITSVGTVIFPRLANSFKKGDSKSVEHFLKLSFDAVNLISIPIAFGLIAISKPFSAIYFGKEFSGIEVVVSILAIELIFMGWSTVLGNQFLVAIDKVKGLTVSVTVATIVLLISSLLLVPVYGAAGAAFTSAFGEFTIAIVQILYVRRYIKLKPVFSGLYKFFVAGVLMLISCYVVSLFNISNNFLSIVVQVAIGGITYLMTLLILKPDILNIEKLKETFLSKC
ncbi:oligosaccharide flippase family protein [Streptococcus saliviloxodontae]|uniref:O-antigen/teichoic acid export membrane protein n=1 Tax=Streptococcus saliviloxodontae TaxID=1349416 RepID=A0ABS2PKM9_9STRE|nr:oligosaccharide flippase family protein [Streptococcus saliviloxodontae]MBM7635988.1 O-antigen/teichoic acid export membrane protein [Streptococcus saliviloxodontae]